MPQNIIKQRLAVLTPEYRDFVMSEYPYITTEIFGSQFRLNRDQMIVFENGLMLYLLVFLSKYELEEFLISECQIPIIATVDVVETIIGGLPRTMADMLKTLSLELREKEESPIQDKNRTQVLDSISKNKLYFYLYTVTGNKLGIISQRYDFSEAEVRTTLTRTVGDIVLGFYRVQDTVPLLQQELGVDPHTAALLGADVLEFLAPLSDPNWQPPAEISEIESEDTVETVEAGILPLPTAPIRATVLSPVNSATPPTIQPTTATYQPPAPLPYPPPVAPKIPPMARDMAHPIVHQDGLVGGLNYEPVYTSSQDNLRRSLYETPNYTDTDNHPINNQKPAPEEPPRWGSQH